MTDDQDGPAGVPGGTRCGDCSLHRGAGLGLSIVAAVAHAHGGDVHAQPGDDGGLTIRVEISTVPRPNRHPDAAVSQQ